VEITAFFGLLDSKSGKYNHVQVRTKLKKVIEMNLRVYFRCVLLILSLMPHVVMGALVEREWEKGTPGNADITFDSTTGLEWLDLTITANLSKNTVLDLLVNDTSFYGWRYATGAEWTSLVSGAGVDPSLFGTGYNSELYAPVLNLMTFLGTTYVTIGDNNATQGILADQYGLSSARRTYMEIRHDMGDVARVEPGWGIPVYSAYSQIGSYLVREPTAVPLPSAVYLFISGMLMLFTRHKSIKKI